MLCHPSPCWSPLSRHARVAVRTSEITAAVKEKPAWLTIQQEPWCDQSRRVDSSAHDDSSHAFSFSYPGAAIFFCFCIFFSHRCRCKTRMPIANSPPLQLAARNSRGRPIPLCKVVPAREETLRRSRVSGAPGSRSRRNRVRSAAIVPPAQPWWSTRRGQRQQGRSRAAAARREATSSDRPRQPFGDDIER
jgi:hypothetical protein